MLCSYFSIPTFSLLFHFFFTPSPHFTFHNSRICFSFCFVSKCLFPHVPSVCICSPGLPHSLRWPSFLYSSLFLFPPLIYLQDLFLILFPVLGLLLPPAPPCPPARAPARACLLQAGEAKLQTMRLPANSVVAGQWNRCALYLGGRGLALHCRELRW